MNTTDSITPDELRAAYRAAGLHRMRFGLAKALESRAIYIALRCTALARRKRLGGRHTPQSGASQIGA